MQGLSTSLLTTTAYPKCSSWNGMYTPQRLMQAIAIFGFNCFRMWIGNELTTGTPSLAVTDTCSLSHVGKKSFRNRPISVAGRLEESYPWKLLKMNEQQSSLSIGASGSWLRSVKVTSSVSQACESEIKRFYCETEKMLRREFFVFFTAEMSMQSVH